MLWVFTQIWSITEIEQSHWCSDISNDFTIKKSNLQIEKSAVTQGTNFLFVSIWFLSYCWMNSNNSLALSKENNTVWMKPCFVFDDSVKLQTEAITICDVNEVLHCPSQKWWCPQLHQGPSINCYSCDARDQDLDFVGTQYIL